MALEARVLTEAETAGILAIPSRCEDKWTDVIEGCVMRDKSAAGTTRTNMKFVPAARTGKKSTKQGGRSYALQMSVSSSISEAMDQHHIITSLLSGGHLLTLEGLVKAVVRIGMAAP